MDINSNTTTPKIHHSPRSRAKLLREETQGSTIPLINKNISILDYESLMSHNTLNERTLQAFPIQTKEAEIPSQKCCKLFQSCCAQS